MIGFIAGVLCMIGIYCIFCIIAEWLDNDGWW